MKDSTLFGIVGAAISAAMVIFARYAAKNAADAQRRMGLSAWSPRAGLVFYRVFGSAFFFLCVYLIFR